MMIAPLLEPTTLSLVFVYGTLKRGFGNHHIMAPVPPPSSSLSPPSSSFVSVARTVDKYPLFTDHYKIPYLLSIPGEGGTIRGELWSVDGPTLEKLDVLEGVASGRYVRTEIAVTEERDPSERDPSPPSSPPLEPPARSSAWLYSLPGERREEVELERRRLVEEYTMEEHRGFVKPGEGRDATRRREWGGYE